MTPKPKGSQRFMGELVYLHKCPVCAGKPILPYRHVRKATIKCATCGLSKSMKIDKEWSVTEYTDAVMQEWNGLTTRCLNGTFKTKAEEKQYHRLSAQYHASRCGLQLATNVKLTTTQQDKKIEELSAKVDMLLGLLSKD